MGCGIPPCFAGFRQAGLRPPAIEVVVVGHRLSWQEWMAYNLPMEPEKKNFHLPLPEGLYERLRSEAQRSKTPATRLVRKALECFLAERERQAVHDAVVEYATRMAGTPEDLDEELEAAGLESLAKLEPWAE